MTQDEINAAVKAIGDPIFADISARVRPTATREFFPIPKTTPPEVRIALVQAFAGNQAVFEFDPMTGEHGITLYF